MAVLLVRHALAVPRRKWDGRDELRPLTRRGDHQAAGLVSQLRRYRIDEILPSPTLRCVQTVRPVAAARNLSVKESEALAEGSREQALALIRNHMGGHAVLCSHGDVISFVLDAIAGEDGLDLGEDPPCAKGSTWVLRGTKDRFTAAQYLPPPAQALVSGPVG
jgi:broad specificity phosphatase PhoE